MWAIWNYAERLPWGKLPFLYGGPDWSRTRIAGLRSWRPDQLDEGTVSGSNSPRRSVQDQLRECLARTPPLSVKQRNLVSEINIARRFRVVIKRVVKWIYYWRVIFSVECPRSRWREKVSQPQSIEYVRERGFGTTNKKHLKTASEIFKKISKIFLTFSVAVL